MISLVPLGDVYGVTNFEEPQMRLFHPGMAIELTAGMLGGASVAGAFDRIAPRRAGIRPASHRECHRQFRQDRPAHSGTHSDRPAGR